MGYKLAGYNVIAANDIDNQMRQVYIANHHPKYYVFGDIRKLLTMNYPEEFYNLDILDGSPPCSTFSMAGSREAAWGKAKQFREGQSLQTLDDLFFDFIRLAKKLQPKVIIAENVKGLISGNAKGYFVEIIKQFELAGYNVQSFLLNASTMGVSQMRERVFILCNRKNLNLSKIQISFDEEIITFKEMEKQIEKHTKTTPLTQLYQDYWMQAKPGNSIGKFQQNHKIDPNKPVNTLTAREMSLYHYKEVRALSIEEYAMCGSFPQDYDYLNIKPQYLIGMSVPPVMTAQVANQVYKQWLN